MASLLLLKVIHMLANILFLQNTKEGQASIFSVYVYTWIFQNLVSKIINSFYYLAISNNKTSFKGRLKAFIWLWAVSQ